MTELQKTPESLSSFAERASFSLTSEQVNINAQTLAIKDVKQVISVIQVCYKSVGLNYAAL